MKDGEPQGICINIFIIIIYTDKLHAAALDWSFHLPLKKQVCTNVDVRAARGLMMFTVVYLSLSILPRIFPLAHSSLDLFINSDRRHCRLKKTEKQTSVTRGWI